jgi:hypothetical protein
MKSSPILSLVAFAAGALFYTASGAAQERELKDESGKFIMLCH